jgi:hypothetical protein
MAGVDRTGATRLITAGPLGLAESACFWKFDRKPGIGDGNLDAAAIVYDAREVFSLDRLRAPCEHGGLEKAMGECRTSDRSRSMEAGMSAPRMSARFTKCSCSEYGHLIGLPTMDRASLRPGGIRTRVNAVKVVR